MSTGFCACSFKGEGHDTSREDAISRRELIAVLELHTYSSLNEQFLSEYHGALVRRIRQPFLLPACLELKRMPLLSKKRLSGVWKTRAGRVSGKRRITGLADQTILQKC